MRHGGGTALTIAVTPPARGSSWPAGYGVAFRLREPAEERLRRQALGVGVGEHRAAKGGLGCLECDEADAGAGKALGSFSGSSASPAPVATARSSSTSASGTSTNVGERRALTHRDDHTGRGRNQRAITTQQVFARRVG
jgi:hypothetical protein